MTSPNSIEWRQLPAAIAHQCNACDRETALLRGAHLQSVIRLTPYAMAANVGSAAVALWTFGRAAPPGMWLWFALIVAVSALGLFGTWRRRLHVRMTASPRSVRQAAWHAAALGGLWAVLPLAWFAPAEPALQLVIATLVTGMLGAGTFMLSPLPRASMVYAAIYTVAALMALWRSGNPTYLGTAVMLAFYSAMVVTASLSNWMKATAQLRSKTAAERQEGILAVLLQDFEQSAGEALWETGPDGRLRQLSQRLGEMLGIGEAEARAEPLLQILARRCSAGAQDFQRALDSGRPFRELRLALTGAADGDGTRHLTINGKSLVDESNSPLGWRGVVADVTPRVLAEQRLRLLAHTDSLTELANRFTLRDTLAEHLRAGQRGALLAIDLDHFKAVNDTLGHSAGDELLKKVAHQLRLCVRPGDLVARLGGDEFAVLMALPGGQDDAQALAQRIVRAIGTPMEVQGRRLQIGASVGVALWQGGTEVTREGVDELLIHADVALYDAKGAGRGRHAIYSRQLGDRNRRRLDIEEGLRHAIERGQLSLHWQPQIATERWEIAGAEALLRWNHPTLGQVAPSEFIIVAEQCGLIDDLGRWALREACGAAADVLAGLKVSVNVSALQLRNGGFVDEVRQVLLEFALPPAQLELEITESVFIDDAEAALAQLHALHALGVRVALDDFGTGYSSLAYLRRFPFDTLKIDRAFVNEVLLREDARAIVQMVAQLARTLGMRTVCEGVETAQQLTAVTQAGCDEIQGYLISRPRPIASFAQWRNEWRKDAPRPSPLH